MILFYNNNNVVPVVHNTSMIVPYFPDVPYFPEVAVGSQMSQMSISGCGYVPDVPEVAVGPSCTVDALQPFLNPLLLDVLLSGNCVLAAEFVDLQNLYEVIQTMKYLIYIMIKKNEVAVALELLVCHVCMQQGVEKFLGAVVVPVHFVLELFDLGKENNTVWAAAAAAGRS